MLLAISGLQLVILSLLQNIALAWEFNLVFL